MYAFESRHIYCACAALAAAACTGTHDQPNPITGRCLFKGTDEIENLQPPPRYIRERMRLYYNVSI